MGQCLMEKKYLTPQLAIHKQQLPRSTRINPKLVSTSFNSLSGTLKNQTTSLQPLNNTTEARPTDQNAAPKTTQSISINYIEQFVLSSHKSNQQGIKEGSEIGQIGSSMSFKEMKKKLLTGQQQRNKEVKSSFNKPNTQNSKNASTLSFKEIKNKLLADQESKKDENEPPKQASKESLPSSLQQKSIYEKLQIQATPSIITPSFRKPPVATDEQIIERNLMEQKHIAMRYQPRELSQITQVDSMTQSVNPTRFGSASRISGLHKIRNSNQIQKENGPKPEDYAYADITIPPILLAS